MDDEKLSNGYDPNDLAQFVGRIESIEREIEGIRDRAKEEESPLRDDIALVKRESADAGIPKTELGAVLKKRRLERKLERVADKLDLEQRANYEQMLASLERLAKEVGPLGEAARDRAREAAHA